MKRRRKRRRKMITRIIFFLGFLILLVFFTACKDTGTSPEIQECTISVSSSSIEMEIGETQELTATDSNCSSLSWESSDNNVVELQQTIGNKVSITGLTEGNAIIRVTSMGEDDQAAEAVAQVEVIYNPVVVYKKSSEDQSEEDLYISDIRGNERRITQEPQGFDDILGAYQWIENGKRIAYLSLGSGDSDVVSVDLQGEDRITITDDYWNVSNFEISHDGDKIAIVGQGEEEATGLHIQNLETEAINTLVTMLEGFEDSDFPSWSPDNQSIAFSSSRSDSNDYEIYTISPDGSNLTNITNSPDNMDLLPVWSPDGSKIVFISLVNNSISTYVMDADGNNVQQVTDEPLICTSWISNEELVCGEIYDGTQADLHRLRLDGASEVLFEWPDSDEFSPDWRRME